MRPGGSLIPTDGSDPDQVAGEARAFEAAGFNSIRSASGMLRTPEACAEAFAAAGFDDAVVMIQSGIGSFDAVRALA